MPDQCGLPPLQRDHWSRLYMGVTNDLGRLRSATTPDGIGTALQFIPASVFICGCVLDRARATAPDRRLGLPRLLGEVLQLRFDEIDEVVEDDGRIERPEPPPAVEGLAGQFESVAYRPR